MEFVHERIAIANSSEAMDEKTLIRSEISAAIAVAENLNPHYDIVLCKETPLVAGPGNYIPDVDMCINTALMLLKVHKKILIFCHSGQDRSPLVAAAVISELENITFNKTWKQVKERLEGTSLPVDFPSEDVGIELDNVFLNWAKQLGCGQHLVSIVVPCVNGDKERNKITEKCLTSIRQCTNYRPYEIITIDDSISKDNNFISMLEKNSDRVIIHDENMGAAQSRADGNRAAEGEIICQLDNDTIVFPNWLTQLVGTLVRNEQVAIVAPLYTCNMAYFATRDNAMLYDEMYQVEEVGAACMVYFSELVEQIGNFDPKLYNLWEDKDFCNRISKETNDKGDIINREDFSSLPRHAIIIDPNVAVYHSGYIDPYTGVWTTDPNNTRSMDGLQDREKIAKSMRLIYERWGEKHAEYDSYVKG